MSTVALGLSFIFGNLLKEIFESVVLLLVMHPYDVGDRIQLGDGDTIRIYTVQKINIMTTEVRDLANHCIYLKNNALYNEASLVNLGRSLNAVVEIGVTFQTSEMSTAVSYRINQYVNLYVQENAHDAQQQQAPSEAVPAAILPELCQLHSWGVDFRNTPQPVHIETNVSKEEADGSEKVGATPKVGLELLRSSQAVHPKGLKRNTDLWTVNTQLQYKVRVRYNMSVRCWAPGLPPDPTVSRSDSLGAVVEYSCLAFAATAQTSQYTKLYNLAKAPIRHLFITVTEMLHNFVDGISRTAQPAASIPWKTSRDAAARERISLCLRNIQEVLDAIYTGQSAGSRDIRPLLHDLYKKLEANADLLYQPRFMSFRRFLACVKRMLPKSPIPPREVASVSNSSVGSEVDDARKRWAKEWFYQGMQNMVKKVGAIALKAAISGFWSEILGSLWQAFFPPPLWKEYSVMKLMMEWTEQYVQRTIAAELKDDIAGKMCDLEDATGELNKCMASLKEEIEKAKKQRSEPTTHAPVPFPESLFFECLGKHTARAIVNKIATTGHKQEMAPEFQASAWSLMTLRRQLYNVRLEKEAFEPESKKVSEDVLEAMKDQMKFLDVTAKSIMDGWKKWRKDRLEIKQWRHRSDDFDHVTYYTQAFVTLIDKLTGFEQTWKTKKAKSDDWPFGILTDRFKEQVKERHMQQMFIEEFVPMISTYPYIRRLIPGEETSKLIPDPLPVFIQLPTLSGWLTGNNQMDLKHHGREKWVYASIKSRDHGPIHSLFGTGGEEMPEKYFQGKVCGLDVGYWKDWMHRFTVFNIKNASDSWKGKSSAETTFYASGPGLCGLYTFDRPKMQADGFGGCGDALQLQMWFQPDEVAQPDRASLRRWMGNVALEHVDRTAFTAGTFLSLALNMIFPQAVAEGNPTCWQEGFSYEMCCGEKYGPEGNKECWDGMHTFQTCCLPGVSGYSPVADFEDLMARGSTGDVSVLPAIIQLISSGGEDCTKSSHANASGCDTGGNGISGRQWKAFFEGASMSKFMRLQPWPPDGEPSKLWTACCSNSTVSIRERVLTLAESCAAGAAALVLSVLPQLDATSPTAALEGYDVGSELAERLQETGDCRWLYQTNRAAWMHYDWFMSPPEKFLPCVGSLRIFVDERETASVLREAPLSCAHRGLCFTEVWVHEFFQRASCRVDDPAQADFVYVPIYLSCYDMQGPKRGDQALALETLMGDLMAQEGPPVLLVFTCEKWKMKGWRSLLGRESDRSVRDHVVAAVETRPLLGPEDDARILPGTAWSCEDCFRFGLDVVLPSAVPAPEAYRLRFFNRELDERTLLLVWRGEHAESDIRSDVREGYIEVNETVRPRIIKYFESKPDADVGRPSMRYSFLMGNSHFCLVPRGRGWWTVRLFEAFYAGCVPVLLSDDVELPFEDFLDWDTFSLKWPMLEVGESLYLHLRALKHDQRKMRELHEGVRAVSCWFDFLDPSGDCSPYQGLLRQLARKRQMRPRKTLRRFWF
ncbi:ARAD1 [Symbiodinium microadriaticum]|nr:ARAD1 [Symbiodinium microadriaticum]